MAMSESALARSETDWAIVHAAAALFVAFYGSSAAGMLMMARARGMAPPPLEILVRAALTRAHRLLLVLLVVGVVAVLLAGLLLGALWLCRLGGVGPLLYVLVVPAGVALCGAAAVASVAVVAPLAAPSVWAGCSVPESLRMMWHVVRRRLVLAAMLTVALSLLVGLVGAMSSFGVLAGGKVVAEASALLGLDVPVPVLMASLTGVGLRGLVQAGLTEVTPHVVAAAIGGGLVFIGVLVMSALVYLRGVCEMFLALSESLARRD